MINELVRNGYNGYKLNTGPANDDLWTFSQVIESVFSCVIDLSQYDSLDSINSEYEKADARVQKRSSIALSIIRNSININYFLNDHKFRDHPMKQVMFFFVFFFLFFFFVFFFFFFFFFF